ncbi:unnamed protein product [Triticum aestivum]|uniref:Uncharacterized protein n=3 Tax=Triticinae TaxID=1648030 RepID=A0A453AZS0_AEGTS|nr:unnamed protein product [Triticum aestivum]
MGLEVLTARDQLPRCRYQRLRGELCDDGDGEEVGNDVTAAGAASAARWTRARRPLRLRRRLSGKKAVPVLFRMAQRRRGVRLLMRLVLLAPARRAAALLAELVRRIACAAECPAIVFSSQWGLPALSHSASGGASRTARLRAFYLERSLSAGSPC